MLKNIIKIFKKDMKNVFKNPITTLIVTGVCILPSLYAWVNIKACWDPYGNAKNIPVAIVNEDNGINIMGKYINAGNKIVEKLKNNYKIGWKFVNSKNADMGIVDGTYYAIIKIPANFSKDLTSLTSPSPTKPEIEYKVNTKNSPVAIKITDSARNSLTDQIKSNFVYTVNESIFSSLNPIAKDIYSNKQSIINLKDSIIKLSDNIDIISNILSSINSNSNGLNSILKNIESTISLSNSNISSIEDNNYSTNSSILSIQSEMNDSFSNIELNLETAKSDICKIQELIQTLNLSSSNSKHINVDITIDKIENEIDISYNRISRIINFLTKVNNVIKNVHISNFINSMENIKNTLSSEKNKINNIKQQFDKTANINKSLLDSTANDIANLYNKLTDEIYDYNNNVKNNLNLLSNEMIESTKQASSLLELSKKFNTYGENSINTLLNGTQLTAQSSNKLNNRLYDFKNQINNLANKLKLTNNNDIIQILTILQDDPSLIGNFISNPFNIKEQNIYTISNFGSAMAPAYTTLAIWVGSIVLVAIFKTDADRFKGDENFTPKERYLGKMSTFIAFALTQGFVVAFGDRFLINVQMANTFLAIIVALISAFTFTVITYTLVSIFGNGGKAMSIILIITQIFGSGATYPIQLDPHIFQIIQPLLPFTYSVSGFREAIAGPLVSSVFIDFTFMILTSIFFIILGLFLKKPLQNKIYKIKTNLKKSGIGD